MFTMVLHHSDQGVYLYSPQREEQLTDYRSDTLHVLLAKTVRLIGFSGIWVTLVAEIW